MSQAPERDRPSSVLAQLVKKCASLCQRADAAIENLSAERESFLMNSLGEALKHLELVLRVLGDEQGTNSREERQGFLRWLFARGPTGEKEEFPPRFDVSHHGLQGNSLTVSLAELLSFLSFARKTGVLWVDAPDENFLISLVDGRMTHATSDRTPEGLRLGEVLERLNCLTRRQLERFIEKRRKNGAAISGEVLLKNGMITEEELQSALKYQVQQLVMRVVNTKTAIFRFREGMEVLLASKVNLDVNQLLLETARTLDEANGADQRQNELLDDWSAWQRELAAESGGARTPSPDARTADAGAEDADARKAARSSEPDTRARPGESRPDSAGKKR